MPKLSRLLPEEIKQLKFETLLKFESSILDVISQTFSQKLPMSLICVEFSRSTHIFASFAIKMIGNETGRLLKFMVLNRNVIKNF